MRESTYRFEENRNGNVLTILLVDVLRLWILRTVARHWNTARVHKLNLLSKSVTKVVLEVGPGSEVLVGRVGRLFAPIKRLVQRRTHAGSIVVWFVQQGEGSAHTEQSA